MVWWLTSVGLATTYQVGPGQRDLSDTLDIAVDGDILEIHPGTYTEPITLGTTSLTLVSLQGPSETLLTPWGGVATVVVDGAAPIVLQGLTIDGGGIHRGLQVTDGNIEGIDLTFIGGNADVQGGFGGDILADGSTLTMRNSRFDNPTVVDLFGAHVYLSEVSATFEGCSFSHGSAGDDGGAIFAFVSDDLQFHDCTFTDNVARFGGALRCLGCALHIEDSVSTGNQAHGSGGSISASLGSFTVKGTTFEGDSAAFESGAIELTAVGEVLVEDSRVTGTWADTAAGGIGIYDPAGAIIVRRSVFEDNTVSQMTGGIGGGLFVAATYLTAPVTIEGSSFCNNGAHEGGAYYVGGLPAAQTIRNTVFVNNSADDGAAVYLSGQVGTFDHNVVLSNTGTVAAVTLGPSTQLDATHNAFVQNGTALSAPAGGLFESYNLFDADLPLHGDDAPSPTDLFAEAEFVDPLLNCSANLRPQTDSPLVDGGDPALSDPDGTPPDIGAYGGPNAPELVDVDADGFLLPEDCAYSDATVHPLATEAPADEIDQDCDGLDLCYIDADQDGIGSDTLDLGPVGCAENGWGLVSGDCDDADPTVTTDCGSPPVETIPPPPIETIPLDDPSQVPPSWFCGPRTPASLWLVCLPLLGIRHGSRRGRQDRKI